MAGKDFCLVSSADIICLSEALLQPIYQGLLALVRFKFMSFFKYTKKFSRNMHFVHQTYTIWMNQASKMYRNPAKYVQPKYQEDWTDEQREHTGMEPGPSASSATEERTATLITHSSDEGMSKC